MASIRLHDLRRDSDTDRGRLEEVAYYPERISKEGTLAIQPTAQYRQAGRGQVEATLALISA